MISKMYIVVRADLSPAQQGVQGMHAYGTFEAQHSEVYRDWYRKSNTLAFLSVPDERALGVLLSEAAERDIPAAAFHEPDLGGSLTAIALGPQGKKLTKKLRKALHDPAPESQQNHECHWDQVPLAGGSDPG